MFSAEIKINGIMIAHLYGHNQGVIKAPDDYEYLYRYYRPEDGTVTEGKAIFKRSGGIEKLISNIMEEVANASKS